MNGEVTGYKWDYIIHKWGYKVLNITGILGHNFWKTHRLNDFVGGFPRDYILLMRTKI